MECDVGHGEVHSTAQRLASAAQSCNIVLTQVICDVAEQIRWQVCDCHALHSVPCHDGGAAGGLCTACDQWNMQDTVSTAHRKGERLLKSECC
jgi:hypothetical protein